MTKINLILDNTNCPVNSFAFVKEAVEHITKSDRDSRATVKRQTNIWNIIDNARINGMDLMVSILIKTQINDTIEDVRAGIVL